MSSCGMGAIYTKTSEGKLLRSVSPKEREAMLIHYYDPYHSEFTHKVKITLIDLEVV